MALYVTLTGLFLTGRCNINKINNPILTAYEINLKREYTLKLNSENNLRGSIMLYTRT